MSVDKATLERTAAQVLAANRVMNLASGTAESLWCSTLFCKEEDSLDIICVVEDRGSTMRNIRKSPRVAFTVNLQVPDRFVQGKGIAHVLGPIEQFPELVASMTAKVPEMRQFLEAVPGLSVVRIVTDRLAVSDMPNGVFPSVTLFRKADGWALEEEVRVLAGVKAWLFAMRPWSFPASLMPMLVGGALAYCKESFDVPLLLLTLLGGLLFHIGANMLNTYFDFRRGTDHALDADDRTLVDSFLEPQQVFWGSGVALAVGAMAGGALAYIAGWPVLVLGAIGATLAIFYTAGPVGYKYRALGDIGIFTSFGPLLVLGAYFVQTERFDLLPFVVSLPLGLLIDAILHANNFRDMEADRRTGALTLAQLTGEGGAKLVFYILLLAPYLFVVSFGVTVSPWALLPILTLPAALQLLVQVRLATGDRRQAALAVVPQKTAQLNLLFGALLAAALFTSRSL
jgi:1,4-dihydroxy-2-naphthoate octaprenyltransferase